MALGRQTKPAAALEFESVSFRYAQTRRLPFTGGLSKENGESIHGRAAAKGHCDEDMVLHDLSFRIESGERAALVGPTGAGKSTTFDLVTGVIAPLSGRILIDGKDASQLSREERLRLLAVVPQEAGLFDESIFENIRYGLLNLQEDNFENVSSATLDQVASAAAAAGVTEFSDRLEKGLNSPCGPRGSLLSGGQRQRIAIARALIRRAPILMLDEPTSALDAETEAYIQKAIKAWAPSQTVFVISHRLATVQDADQILVLNDGGLEERGTHTELMVAGGWYGENYQTQLLQ